MKRGRSPRISKKRRFLYCGTIFLLAVFSSSCFVVIISGPSLVSAGTTVTYVLQVSGAEEATNELFYVVSYVPEGWSLTSSPYSGTASGSPISGSGTVIPGGPGPCGSTPTLTGYQQIWLQAGPFTTTDADIAEVTLEFFVDSQPSGQYQIYFSFGIDSYCSSLRPLVINRSPFLGVVEVLTNDGANDGLSGAGRLAAAPDGLSLYPTSGGENSVSTYARNVEDGTLSFVEKLVGPQQPSALEITGDGQNLYLTDEIGNALYSYTIDPSDGTLDLLEVFQDGVGGVDGLAQAKDLSISADGGHVYVASFDDDGISIFERLPGPPAGLLAFSGFEPSSVGCCTQGVLVSRDGATVYAAQEHSIVVYQRDSLTGNLTFVEAQTQGVAGVEGIANARFLFETPDSRHLLVSPFSRSVAVFHRAPGGTLTFHDALFSGIDAPPLTLGGNMTSVDDRHVAMLGGGLSWLLRNPATGDLRFFRGFFSADPNTPELGGANRIVEIGDSSSSQVYLRAGIGTLVVLDSSQDQIFVDGFESGDTSMWN